MELSRRSVLLGIGAVTAFLAVDLGAVAYANKWIGPGNTLTRESFLNAFRSVFGAHLGFRRNHAKGVVVTGHFESNGNGSELSRAVIFRPGQTPVTGRFSLASGNPNVADAAADRGGGVYLDQGLRHRVERQLEEARAKQQRDRQRINPDGGKREQGQAP